jgi:predicted Zn finger-like uncharacterized protein
MPVTRCPECATAFRVTDEQLQARAGQVRCGHCGEVFDAIAALEPNYEPPPAARAPEPARVTPPARAADMTLSRPAPLEEDWVPIEPEPPGRARAAWAALAVLLLLVLVGQIAFYFRGTIAIVWPQSKPFLTAACARLRCDLPLPRKADLVTIETSDLQADPANPAVMVLSATLRNRAAFPQAFPALELTLTNERDQPLARRVLQPSDYLREKRDEGLAPSAELQVKLFLDAAAVKASSYRLYLFYP